MAEKIKNLGVIIAPGSANEDKKSGWRTFRPVITDKCAGCSICVSACPEGGMVIENKKIIVNYDYCKGCMICFNVCPLKAIEKKV